MATPSHIRIGLCVLAIGAGCSGSSGGGSADAGVDEGGGDGGGGGEPFAISVHFLDDDAAVNGATVALDLGGVRSELTTDSSGLAIFNGLTFGNDTASITVYRSGYGVISYVGLGQRDDVLQVRLPRRSPVSGTVATIQGTASGMVTPSNSLLVTSTAGVPNTAVTTPLPPDYEVEVEPDTEGSLVALEYDAMVAGGPRDSWIDHKQWAIKSHPAVPDLADVDLDFVTDAATSVAVAGTLVLPTRSDSPLRTDAVAQLRVFTDNLTTLVGVWQTSTLGTGRFDVTGAYVVAPGTFEPQTIYQLLVIGAGSTTKELSTVTEFAYPTDGFEINTFLDSPEITSAVELSPIEDEITWTPFETVPLTWLRVSTEDNPPERVWDVFLPEGATSVTFPALPTGVNRNGVLGTSPLSGRVYLCDLDDARNTCLRQAISQKIELIP